MQALRSVVLIVALFLLAAAPACSDDVQFTGTPCETYLDCSDGQFCNGEELCLANECVTVPPVTCNDGIDCTVDECNEVTDRCEFRAPDADEDGVGDASCLDERGEPLGTDCDDDDPTVYAGNVEVCDADDVDEDCDPNTFGSSDDDGDGLVSVGCCNRTADGLKCGTDCNDTNAAIVHGSQVCVAFEDQAVDICQVDGSYLKSVCPQQRRCLRQPNGTGVCVP